MSIVRRSLITASLVALSAGTVFAQATATPAAPAAQSQGPHRMDPAKRQEHFDRRMTELKQELQIMPGQETAWTTYLAAIKPQPHGTRPDREAFAKLTTPQRIDQMRAMQQERSAQMERRGDATKAFYAQLTPQQQQTFDELGAKRMRGHHGGGHGHGQGHGPRG